MESPNTKPYSLPSDAVWFITGCSSGIGQALAQLIAQTPNRVVATARKTAALASIPESERVFKLELDVTSTDSIDVALRATLAKFGRIDVVVNNAGYTLAGDAEGAGDEEARAIMNTNFWGSADMSKRALGIMRDENPKNGQQGVNSFYHASKFAVEGWTEAVAKELPTDWNSTSVPSLTSSLLNVVFTVTNPLHLCIIEPGGVKTNYATSSLKPMAKRHPAYSDPSYPSNMLLGFVTSEQGRALWAEPSALATAIYLVVSRGKRIPIRVPLGSDACGMILKDLESTKNDMDEVKDISLSVGDAKRLDSVKFLM